MEAGESVGDDKIIDSTHLEVQKAVFVLASTMLSNDSVPGLMFCSHSSIEVSKDNYLLWQWDSINKGIKFFIEFVLDVKSWSGLLIAVTYVLISVVLLLILSGFWSIIRRSLVPPGSFVSFLARWDLIANPQCSLLLWLLQKMYPLPCSVRRPLSDGVYCFVLLCQRWS